MNLKRPEKLLLAAFRLDRDGKTRFSIEDLIVCAWRLFPDTFGLDGHRGKDGKLMYPDSEKVHKLVISSAPIRRDGYLRKVGRRMFQVTESGREKAKFLQSSETKTAAERLSLPRETTDALKKLFVSRVLDKFKNGQTDEITFSDACSFWGISPRSSAVEFAGEISNLTKMVAAAKKIAKGKKVSFQNSGEVFGENDLDLLMQTHEVLLQKFEKELSIIRQRTDERGKI